MSAAEFSARIGKRGQKTPDSMAEALQELHAVGVPGGAKLVITGAQGGWSITAYWEHDPDIVEAAPPTTDLPDLRGSERLQP